MKNVRETLQQVFCDVFDNASIVLQDSMSAKDFDDWDSLQHINLIIATEKAFGIKFATAEISRLKQPGQNVGTFVECIESKIKV